MSTNVEFQPILKYGLSDANAMTQVAIVASNTTFNPKQKRTLLIGCIQNFFSMKIVLPDKQEITVVNNYNGVYSAHVNGKDVKLCEREIFPASVTDFIQQQLFLMKQIWHFGKTLGIYTDIEVISTQKFVLSEMPAIESTTDWCFLFEDYLAICRKDEQIPYALLQQCDIGKEKCTSSKLILDDATWYSSICEFMDEHLVRVVHNGTDLWFVNKRYNYSLDMGLMYLFLKNKMFQDAFVVNSMAIDTFIKTKPRYDYEPLQRILHYESDDGCTQKIVSFLTKHEDFFIQRKITYTWQRHKVFQCDSFIPLSNTEFVYDKAQPTNPIHFLHLQLVHAVHLFEYVMNELKVHKLKSWIQSYRSLCFQILKRFQDQKSLNKLWNPNDAISLLKENDCTVHGYSLHTDYLDKVWHNDELQLAWFSNLQHLIQAYLSILDGDVVYQDLVANGNVAIINNYFVGSFHMDPIRMQATVVEEEKKFFWKKINAYMKKEVSVVSFIYPTLDVFAESNRVLMEV